ncbi:MAG: hypothetical protein ACI4FV_02285 [Lachnospiraceae bacterium]
MSTLAHIAKAEHATSLSDFSAKAKEMLSFFIDRHLSYTDRPLNLLVYACYILFFLAAILCWQKKAVRDILFTGVARMVIWAYLVYNGRLPARVSQSVYIAELLILLAIALKYELWKFSLDAALWKSSPRVAQGKSSSEATPENPSHDAAMRNSPKSTLNIPYIFWCLILCCFVFLAYRFGFPKARAAADEASSRLQFSQSFVDIKDYFADHPENLYYLDMNSFGSFTEDGLQGGINTYGNYLFMGSWVPHSPWYAEKFERSGIKEADAAAALFENPNVYAVFMKTEGTGYEYLSDFYAENYPGVTLEVVEEITVSNDITFQILHGSLADMSY